MADLRNNLNPLLERLEQALLATVPATVQEMGVKEKTYCVFIVFHDTTVYDDFRPNLVVAPERLRRQLFESELHAADIVWNPSLLDVHAESPGSVCNGPGLRETCAEIYRILIDNRQELAEDELLSPVRSAMRRVATKLNHFNWSQLLDTTDDFVVIAIDDMGWDPQSDIRACVQPERVALLDSRGLLANRPNKCPECGQTLRTPQAKQCFQCGANWQK